MCVHQIVVLVDHIFEFYSLFHFHTVLYIRLLEVRLHVVAEVPVVLYGQRSAINASGEEEDAQ